MIVQKQAKLNLPTVEEIMVTEATYKYECEFCGRRCKTMRGLRIHKASCSKQHGLTDEEYV